MDEILTRVSAVEAQIATVKNKVAYRDLQQMLRPIDRLITEMSREDVECRRMKKTTIRYRELETKAQDLLANLEQMVTFAVLVG